MSTEPGTPASFAPIRKPMGRERLKPYLESYREARSDFTWQAAQRDLSMPANGCLNIAYEAVDRHVDGGRGSHLAARFVDRTWTRVDHCARDAEARRNVLPPLLRLRTGAAEDASADRSGAHTRDQRHVLSAQGRGHPGRAAGPAPCAHRSRRPAGGAPARYAGARTAHGGECRVLN